MVIKRNVFFISMATINIYLQITASCEAGFKLKVKENWLETFSAACSEGKWSEKVFPECIEGTYLLHI